MTPDPELLSQEPVRHRSRGMEERDGIERTGATRSRRPVWVWSVVAVALVVTSLVWFADQRSRAAEATALAGCEHQLSEAALWSEIQMGAMVNYTRSSPGSAPLHLADLMSGRARSVLPKVQRAHRSCGQVRIEPWHFSLVSRHSAVMAYSGALITLLETVAAQGSASFHHDPTLVRLQQAAGLD